MARAKKTLATAAVLKDAGGTPYQPGFENDVMVIPGFEAATVSFTRNIPAVVFTDCRGQQVVVKLSGEGVRQWEQQTRR